MSQRPIRHFPYGTTLRLSDAPFEINGSSLIIHGDRNIIRSSRASIVGSGNSIKGSSVKVSGHSNRITGRYAEVHGNLNAIEGNCSKVHGHDNRVTGSYSKVHGNRNVVEGNSSLVNGDNNQVSGRLAKASGSYNAVRGERASVDGGRNNAVYGSNATAEGGRNNMINGIPAEQEQQRRQQQRQQRIQHLQQRQHITVEESLELSRLIMWQQLDFQMQQLESQMQNLQHVGAPYRPVLHQIFQQQQPPVQPQQRVIPARKQQPLIELTLRGDDEECDTDGNNENDEHCRVCLINKAVVASVCCGKRTLCNSCTRELYQGERIGESSKCLNCRAHVKHVVRIS